MRTSLSDIQQAENFLSGKLAAGDMLLFKAKLMMDPILRTNVLLQQKVYSLVRMYARRKLRCEIEGIHTKIFTDSENTDYCRRIEQLFSNT